MTATTEALIRKTPGVIGGDACIGRTRIAVWMLVEWKQLGLTDEQLLKDYPSLQAEDLDAAWSYYAANMDEVDAAILKNNRA